MNCAKIPFGIFLLGLSIVRNNTINHHGLLYLLWNLFCKMRDNIRGPDSKSTIQHPQAKRKPIARIPRLILPFTPHKFRWSIATLEMWHYSTDKHSDEEASNDQETSNRFDGGESSVGEQGDEATCPDADEIGHKDLPSLNHKSIVEQCVHWDALCSNDLGGAGQTQNPGKEVPPAGKPARHSAVRTGRHWGPVIYYSGVSMK